ncbi:uncharacterized protein MELLADRAFT_106975 [Melampsora larici-populina 98AG31]|uniref:No apical meristem-associated C-terminal domain-containing protein n=1 Tax=Melampsora larici-populina (strain 98AG31 / pathotype 3-4-7) TaxID=747676 RepID=F4RN97_MELLP|nr:uncharacterized protein MELLADRAFT_106975 [Melampsora larici-populina 98AG31]EGG05949.1 hypothetical protein MELLADRAFT_106975 [Melampsora larici-populina 98AG31]
MCCPFFDPGQVALGTAAETQNSVARSAYGLFWVPAAGAKHNKPALLEGTEFARFQCYDLLANSPKWSKYLNKQFDKKKADKSTPGNPSTSEPPMGAKAAKAAKSQPPTQPPEVIELTRALIKSSKAMSKNTKRTCQAIELISQDSFLRGGLEDFDPATQDLFEQKHAKVMRDMEASLADE